MGETSRFEGYDRFKYKFAAKFVANQSVLDVGCGYGEGSLFLAQNGALEVLGIDRSGPALKKAVKNKYETLEFRLLDINSLEYLTSKFDVITFFEVIEHLGPLEQRDAIKKIRDLLNKEGLVIITTNNKNLSSYNPYHRKELTPDEFRNLINTYFKAEFFGIKHKYNPAFKKDGAKNKMVNFLCRPKFMQEVFISIFPVSLKRFINSNFLKLTPMGEGDFELSQNMDNCESFLAVCKAKDL